MGDDDLTPDEMEQVDKTGESAEEAHRSGEFEELRDLIDKVLEEVRGVAENVEQMRTVRESIDIDNGAQFTDVDGDGDADILTDEVKVIPDFADLDLDI